MPLPTDQTSNKKPVTKKIVKKVVVRPKSSSAASRSASASAAAASASASSSSSSSTTKSKTLAKKSAVEEVLSKQASEKNNNNNGENNENNNNNKAKSNNKPEIDIVEIHDEPSLNSKVATYIFRCHAYRKDNYTRKLTSTIPVTNKEAIKSQISDFCEKISTSNPSPVPKKILEKAFPAGQTGSSSSSSSSSSSQCFHEGHDENVMTKDYLEFFVVFCGLLVYEIQLELRHDYPATWRYLNNFHSMSSFTKLDTGRVERLYLLHNGHGIHEQRLSTGRLYSFDFDKMTQINKTSKKVREISRLISRPPSFKDKKAAEIDVELKEAKALEKEAVYESKKKEMMLDEEEDKQRKAIQNALERRKQKLAQERAKRDEKERNEDHKSNKQSASSSSSKSNNNNKISNPSTTSPASSSSTTTTSSSTSTSSTANNNNNTNDTSSSNEIQLLLPPWLEELQKPFPEINIPHGVSREVCEILHREQIDEGTFLLLRPEDFTGLQIPLGPRLALERIIKMRVEKANNENSMWNATTTTNTNTNLNTSQNRPLSATTNSSFSSTFKSQEKQQQRDESITEFMLKVQKDCNLHHRYLIDPEDVELYDLVGAGGMGSVFVAECAQRPCAAKLFADYKNGVAEISVLAALNHKNVVHFIGVSAYIPKSSQFAAAASSSCRNKSAAPEPKLLLLQEIAEGTLSSFLQESKGLPWDSNMLSLAIQVAQGLQYLHATSSPKNPEKQRIIHADVKASNVLLFNDCRTAKLIDFGISKMTDRTHATMTAGGRGTAVWMGPSQFSSVKAVTTWDTYSYSVILLWMILDVPPRDFLPDDPQEIMKEGPKFLQKALEETPLRENCPQYLKEICLKGLSFEDSDRPQDGDAIIELYKEHAEEVRKQVRNVEFLEMTSNTQASTSSSSGGGEGDGGDSEAVTEMFMCPSMTNYT